MFERAHNLGVKALDFENWETEMTKAQVRDQLARGLGFMLVTKFNEGHGWKDPDEYVSIRVTETEHHEK